MVRVLYPMISLPQGECCLLLEIRLAEHYDLCSQVEMEDRCAEQTAYRSQSAVD